MKSVVRSPMRRLGAEVSLLLFVAAVIAAASSGRALAQAKLEPLEQPAQNQGLTIDATTAPEVRPPSAKLFWRLENPFRFFEDPRDTALHRQTYENLLPYEHAQPVLSAERRLNDRRDTRDGWAAGVYAKTCWKQDKNRHQCDGSKDYMNPKQHRVLASLAGVSDPDAGCVWNSQSLAETDRTVRSQIGPCAGPLSFDVPYPDGMRVWVEQTGQIIADETLKVRDILVAGLGDSFASGEGNPDVPVRFSRERDQAYGIVKDRFDLSGYPARAGKWLSIGDAQFNEQNARWNDQACHRSLYSHQLRAALQLSLEDPHRAVTYVGLSCSGAEVTFGLFLRYEGNEWVPNPPQLSQISALSVAQCGLSPAPGVDLPEAYHMRGVIDELQGGLVLRRCDRENARAIDLLLVSAGGNDIGFARLVANAVLADQSLLKKLGGWFGQLHEKQQTDALLNEVDERLKALNRAFHGVLHVPWQESDRIILTAYPPLALLARDLEVCPSGSAGMDVMGAFLLSEERALTSMLLADKLDAIMKKSARQYNWTYANAHRRTFIGRGICAGTTSGDFAHTDDLRLPRKLDGNWVPYNPATYRPYASRQRWFRTPNDAYLTAHFHATGTVLRKALSFNRLSWFQVLLASTYSGAFHPNAEGQAAIADAVVKQGRRILEKYGQ